MHANKCDPRYDSINRSRWEKTDTNKPSKGRNAIIAEKLQNFNKGCADLEKLLNEFKARQRLLASAKNLRMRKLKRPGLSDQEKQAVLDRIATLKQAAETKVLSQERKEELKQQIADLRAKLATLASSLRLYDRDLSVEEMKEVEKMISKLGIVPTMGRIIDRGQTGADITR